MTFLQLRKRQVAKKAWVTDTGNRRILVSGICRKDFFFLADLELKCGFYVYVCIEKPKIFFKTFF